MALAPLDIHHKEFKRAFRGYNDDEVKEYLEKVAREYETVFKDNLLLKEEKEALQKRLEHYQQLENSLRSALVLAQNTAEETKANALKEASLIIEEAKLKAERVKEDAKIQMQELTKELEQLQQEERFFRIKFKTLLESHLQLLQQAEMKPAEDTEEESA